MLMQKIATTVFKCSIPIIVASKWIIILRSIIIILHMKPFNFIIGWGSKANDKILLRENENNECMTATAAKRLERFLQIFAPTYFDAKFLRSRKTTLTVI